MNEDRRQILQMLAEGKVTPDQAERLIAALERAADAPAPRATPKYIRVLVEADEEEAGEEQTKVNIRVPVKLLRAGVKLAGLIPQEAREHINEAMRAKGMEFDINHLRPENLDELIDELQDVMIDVDAKGGNKAKVKVFFE